MMRHRIPTLAGMGLVFVLSACSPKESPRPPAASGVQTREFNYQQGSTVLRGFVAWDAGRTERRPGVLLVHEWWGENENMWNQARRLAQAGYVAFALDMYGNGKSTTHPDSAQAFMAAAVADPATMTARFNAALAELKADPRVDTTRIAAIGYCFGGMVVLSQARAGANLRAVATFHGAMPPPAPTDSGSVKARMLILTGAKDPMVPPDKVDTFAKAMRAAGAVVEVVVYPDAMHGFTNPGADSVGMAGLKYDAAADKASWAALLKMLLDVFG
ncbi:MAG TPA: dienelactone hydrolase family protein [Gemmatimonadales bacterium]|nr:dienelactone hydrolase family protein [Gemmatimonadales bacterium]